MQLNLDHLPIERPAIFAESNRPFWIAARRFMIWLLRELDQWYGLNTFERKSHEI